MLKLERYFHRFALWANASGAAFNLVGFFLNLHVNSMLAIVNVFGFIINSWLAVCCYYGRGMYILEHEPPHILRSLSLSMNPLELRRRHKRLMVAINGLTDIERGKLAAEWMPDTLARLKWRGRSEWQIIRTWEFMDNELRVCKENQHRISAVQ
ncbi:hypothetical protein [Photobacterium halotolerans]|uniref:hypothetical protein n=1 Tax=Photobacterium halotolerans TaxID=265726 RepID=UPI000485CDD2|nr:hypothetical protein [Photobacterium halotolerans]